MEASLSLETLINRKNKKDEPHIKENLAKLCQETQLKWDRVLPIALLRIRVAPRSRLGLSLCGILYGRPFFAHHREFGNVTLLHESKVKHYVQQLNDVIISMNEFIFYRSPLHLEVPLDPFKAGGQVLLKVWKEQGPDHQLEEKWKGP